MNESQLHLALEYNGDYAKNQWPNTIYSLFCLVIGLFGNGYVLFIYKFRMKDKTESRYFIPYLAMADVLASFFTCIHFTFVNFYTLYFPWDLLCKGMIALTFVPGLASTLFLLAIAVQRYTRSRLSGRHFSLFWRRAAVVIILAMSSCLGIPCFLVAGVGEIEFVYNGNNITSINCKARNDQYPVIENVLYGVLVVILTVNIVCIFILYICIAVVVYRRNKKTRPKINRPLAMSGKESIKKTKDIELNSIEDVNAKNQMDNNNECINQNDEKFKTSSPSTEFNKMFATIVLVYALTFLPAGIHLAILVSKNDSASAVLLLDFPVWQMQIYSILARTYVINNIVNPFIYGYFDMEFRKYLKNALPSFCQRKG